MIDIDELANQIHADVFDVVKTGIPLTAIGNTYHVRIKGKWVTACFLYMILVGRPGLGKTPPLGFLYFPIRDYDQRLLEQARKEYEAYAQQQAVKKDGDVTELIEKPRLMQTVISDFTQEAMLSIHYDNPRGIVLLRQEIQHEEQSDRRSALCL